MTTLVFNTSRHAGSLLARLGRVVGAMIDDHAARRARRIQRRELARLGATSGHLLTDIGLSVTEADAPRRRAEFPIW